MNTATMVKPLEILLVEDSPTDVLITQEAFEQVGLLNNLHVVEDGVEALAFLHRKSQYSAAPRPDLILLDWNLPRKNGREVLTELKTDESLKLIPVVILTSSRAEEDILRAYGLYANCYIAKPVDFINFTGVVEAIRQFWFSVVTLPRR
jgi:chemotaxis family two-component system response regulator Rcp1